MTTLRIAGGKVLRPDMSVIEADVLVDQEAGEILEIGPDVDGEDEYLDADGSLVIPGLVNGHCHVAMTLLRGYADDKPLDRWLQEDIWPTEAELTPDDVYAGTKLGVLEMIKSGTTAFGDMYFMVPNIVEAVEESGLRARVGHAAVTVAKDDEAAEEDVQTSVEIAGQYDDSEDELVSSAVMPHSLTTVATEYFSDFAEGARGLDVPLHYHANETTGEVDPIVDEEGMRPLELADEHGLLGSGDYLAHCVHIDETEIDLLADSGAAAIHCPASNMKLASGMAPVQEMLDAGVTVGLGTDGAASNNDLDMFDEIRDAAMIGKLAADDASAVDAETAFSLATTGSAEALGFDSGRIEEGANADLAVIDLDAPRLTPPHDLVSHLAYAVSGSDVRHTVVDGEILMRDREVLTLDEEAVIANATDHAASLVARAEADD
ncbi:amidohydrolase [Natranaeroarchaeum sulfidigenes]|uniref:5-methylthioadenosine/S-adenosylhomocysteine deaminase n=1 Tax=Natranaeroarchaeum sulfidigenes TaxID=2784880 RepID=A0A897MM10_9EURY|nr:amidohydrolase [Natranaeroarchaeum sulfidigenes]QSG01411.1 Cytosine deaminase or related metal-dependent hydrolase [Natranaeroarchaeum sulfidigenes]